MQTRCQRGGLPDAYPIDWDATARGAIHLPGRLLNPFSLAEGRSRRRAHRAAQPTEFLPIVAPRGMSPQHRACCSGQRKMQTRGRRAKPAVRDRGPRARSRTEDRGVSRGRRRLGDSMAGNGTGRRSRRPWRLPEIPRTACHRSVERLDAGNGGVTPAWSPGGALDGRSASSARVGVHVGMRRGVLPLLRTRHRKQDRNPSGVRRLRATGWRATSRDSSGLDNSRFDPGPGCQEPFQCLPGAVGGCCRG